MYAKTVISAIRVTLMGTSIMAFAFAVVSIPIVNKAAVEMPRLPPPIKVVYRTARNPFTLDEIGEESPTSVGTSTTSATIARAAPAQAAPFPSIPGDLAELPKGANVPSIAPLAGSVQLTGIIYGDDPLAMVVDGQHTRTVGVGDSLNGHAIVGITPDEVLLSGGGRLRPGVVKGTDKIGGFEFPTTVPNGDNKGQLVPTIANPNASNAPATSTIQVPPPTNAPLAPVPYGVTGEHSVLDQSNVLQMLQNLAAPSAAPVTTPPQN